MTAVGPEEGIVSAVDEVMISWTPWRVSPIKHPGDIPGF
jgi:hypothetical protein